MCDLRNQGNVQHIQARVTHGLAEQQLGIGAYGGTPSIDVIRMNKRGFDAEAAHGEVQQIVRTAIQGRTGDDVRARTHQRGHAQVQRSLTAGRGDGAYAAFKCRNALLEHRGGGVADTTVDMTRTL